MFQKRLDPWFTLYMSYLFPGHVAMLAWGEAFWPAVWVAGALRYCLVLHFTWCVNSAAHLFGNHPYDPKSWPAENPFVSVVAIGEGWHNWHHKVTTMRGWGGMPQKKEAIMMRRRVRETRLKCALNSPSSTCLPF